MADDDIKKKYNPYSKTPLIVSKGLFTDTNEEFQPDGTYRFALNAQLSTNTGEKGALTNEEGNKKCVNLQDDGAHVIGDCLLNDGRVVLFIVHSSNFPTIGAHSAIAIQNENCTLDYLIQTDCLDFQTTDVINCEFKIQSGCDLIIYFTDRRSKYKTINLSKLPEYVKEGRTLANANTKISGEFGWDCGLFNFNPDYNVPRIDLLQVGAGGRLRVGTYFIAIQYKDASLNPIGWMPSTGPIYVTFPGGNPNPMEISGGLLVPSALIDGFFITNKSIRLQISNLDTRYKYFELAVLEYTQGTSTNNLTYVSFPYALTSDTTEILITELNSTNGFIQDSSANINGIKEYVDIIRAQTQIQNRLIVANLSNIVNDWSVFQKAANQIKSLYFIYKNVILTGGLGCESAIINQRNNAVTNGVEFNKPEFLFDQKTYMRDEVYAFAIVYVFNDGKESPAFHIPGRPAISNVAETTVDGRYSVISYDSGFEVFDVSVGRERWYLDINDMWGQSGSINTYYDNYNAPAAFANGSWDREVYNYVSGEGKPYIDFDTYNGFDISMSNTSFDENQNSLTNSLCSFNGESERWQFVNTSIKFNTQKILQSTDAFNDLQALTNDTLYSAGLCAYYETNTTYSRELDCDGVPIFPHSIVDGKYVMHKIRHHKMPDARKEKIYLGLGSDDDNTLMQLLPLGMYFENIKVPVGYKDQIQGYYIVRGDRAGNKTVIDKGWLNVCDTSLGIRNTGSGINPSLAFGTPDYKLDKTIQQNPIFMAPTDKFGSVDFGVPLPTGKYVKDMHFTGSDYIEFFSPKSSFNNPVNLGGTYYKLENTIVTTSIKSAEYRYTNTGGGNSDFDWTGQTCNQPEAWESKWTFRVWGFIETYDLRLPRMFSRLKQGDFYLLHNVPIVYSEYTLYNQNNIGGNGFTLNNDNHRQTMMLSKLYDNVYTGPIGLGNINDIGKINSIYKPLAYFVGDETNVVGLADLINPITIVNSATNIESITIERLVDNYGSSSNTNAFAEKEVGHFYYASLKNNIVAYPKLEDIFYIKASNVLQTLSNDKSFDKGGDCFITKQRLFKSFQRVTKEDVVDNSLSDGKLAGTVIVGYVESEINAHFRHKFTSDTNYFFRPLDSWSDSLKQAVEDVHLSDSTEVEFIEHLYRYNLDFSADNRNRQYTPLPDVYDYCSECSEKFPHTLRYSEVSLSSQGVDNYRIFLPNSVQEIPTDTGEITNLFNKEQNLFVHTVANLYRLNLAPQELETGNDRVQIGSGTLANAVPQRLFDNASGFGRGGTEFEHASVYCGDMYIWVDNKSKRIYGISKGVEDLSAVGLSMWYRNNLDLSLREQWRGITKKDYPYLNTSGNKCIGFTGVYDPYYERYILTKKDYELTQTILDNLLPESYPLINGKYYWNDTGLYLANADILNEVDLEQNINVKNKSFTISFAIIEKVWTSFHSYRPNHIWNNNLTYFTSINNSAKADYIWQHNSLNYQTFYDVKYDFIYDYVAKGEEPVITKAFDSIEIMGNTYKYDQTNEQWMEIFYSTFDKLHVYNNTQSSGLFDLVVKNPLAYYDITNNFINTRTLSINRYQDIWKVNNLADYTKDVLLGTQTINTTNWAIADYRNEFRTNANMGYIDRAINPTYIDEGKSVYQIQRFRDKFLNVRLYYKPVEDYKIVINTMANLKRSLT